VAPPFQEDYARRNLTQRLRDIFDAIDSKKDLAIDACELSAYLKRLGYKPRKHEVKEMIFEADDDFDGVLKWEEFRRAYERCSADKAGIEPRQLHNVIVFAMHGGQQSGHRLPTESAERLIFLDHGRVSAFPTIFMLLEQYYSDSQTAREDVI
jgi:hypothetical protein